MAEFAVAVGGAFLSSFLAVAFERSSKTRNFIKFFQRKNVIKFDDEILDRLEITLDTISVVLEDGEDKQGKSPAVRKWLANLRHSVNIADDLLDELNIECLRLKLDYDVQHKQPEADLKLSLNPAVIQELMPNLEKVTHRLEYFVSQIQALGLQKFDRKASIPYRAPSSSVVDKSEIFGRDDEKKELIDRVLADGGDSNVSVIAIIGMGGIGKTTLAQLVYNDDQVKGHFKTRAWVCVSEEYDPIRVTKALLMEVNSTVVDDRDDFNRMQVKLEDNLKEKHFLIILDDIWNESYNDWSSLKNPLKCGRRGSKIIVTTRNEKVALVMKNEPFHHMQPICEDQSWCLFKSHAFGNGYHTSMQEFETIGKEIVRKCKGLPLAIKTVAGALRLERDINVWQDFLNSEDWASGGDILPALSLSYKHLPSHLKGCFAFCAVFHKDVPFDKDMVIRLWMANDLVKPLTQKVARVYFEELKSRSFFEWVDWRGYLMHDLINDLAHSVAGNTCIRLEDYKVVGRHQSTQQENELPPDILHFSYLATYDETSRFDRLAQAESLRTFLPIHKSPGQTYKTTIMTSRFRRLRALTLSQYPISLDSFGDPKHLRFLNLASTDIKKLPNAICRCLNLQTLILSYCKKLVELPEDVRLLINLQHLDIQGVSDSLTGKNATWLSLFKDEVQNLSVVVDNIHGSILEHLDKLELRPRLRIFGLEDVVTTKGARKASLKDKDCIETLSFKWSGSAECSEDELNKFAKLQPHINIKHLCIIGYQGTRFPDWLGDSAFSNMEHLELEDCNNCFSLPPLGQLPALKVLCISYMDSITVIGNELYGDGFTSKPFQALEALEISYCCKMKSLPERMHTQLPKLSSLSIWDCPELECFPEGGPPSSLEELKIGGCENMKICPTNWALERLPSLRKVDLCDFKDTLFPEEGLLPISVQELEIHNFPNVESLDEKGLQHLCSLQSLTISQCPNLKYLPQRKISSSLSTIRIWKCKLVESFPEGLASSLSVLSIWNCPILKARIEREKGEDWPKVSHIATISVRD